MTGSKYDHPFFSRPRQPRPPYKMTRTMKVAVDSETYHKLCDQASEMGLTTLEFTSLILKSFVNHHEEAENALTTD